MKKIKFLNGIGGLCAFAVVALVGSLLFTSCEKEDLNATFETEPAKVTINVDVIEFPSGNALSGVAITADKGTVAGTVVTIAAGADGNIAAQEVTIGATAPAGYEEILPVKVKVNALRAGGVATYNATLVAVKTADVPEEQIIITPNTVEGDPITYNMSGGATHNHDGYSWLYNANEYILLTSIKYTLYNEQKVVKNTVEGYDDIADFVAGLVYDKTTTDKLDVKVSAWGMYRAWYVVYPTTTTYAFSYKISGASLGEVVVEAQKGTAAQYEEKAIPGHDHNYIPGHGHGHGHGDENAGGGIVWAD